MCYGADSAERGEGALFFVPAEGLTVETLGVRFDGEVVFKAKHRVEKDEEEDSYGFDIQGPRDGEAHRSVWLGMVGFAAGEPAWNMAEDELGVGRLDGGGLT